MSSSFTLRAVVSFVAAALAACGGGGATNDGTTNLPTPVLAPASDSLVLAVADPTYPADSQDLLAFKTLNAERSRCGFGLLAQDRRLDAAARAHREYMALNQSWSHDEGHESSGFTGFDPFARAVHAGYNASGAGEGLIRGADAGASMRGLLAAPYHAISMLSGWKDLGVSFADGVLVNVYGTQGAMQYTDEIRTYPCAGTSATRSSSTRETPSPFSNFNEVWGQPILVMSPGKLQLTSVRVKGPLTDVPVKVIYGNDHDADPNDICLGLWTCVIPEPLQPLTTYEVQLTWLHSGQPGSRTFTFQTGRD